MDVTSEIQSTYKVTNNTFVHQVLDKPGHDLQVQIGDISSPTFKPHINIIKWQNEVNVSVELIETDSLTPNISTSGNKILYQKPSHTVSFTSIDSDDTNLFELGGHEFDITYNAKPNSNIISFKINSNNLDFFYQPPLTSEEIAKGENRPDNIIGSYAIYHSSKSNNQIGGNQYFTGKVGHIYRPLITDSSENTTWGELNIENGVMTITIPQDFLDNATYPIIVDPTFGYTTIGGTQSSGYGPNQFLIFPTTLAFSSATISSMAIYASFASGGNFQLGIYDTSASPVYQGKTIQQGSAPSSAQWSIISMNDCNVLTTGNYFLVQNHDTAQIVLYQDTGGSQEYYNYAYGFGSWPNPMINGADYGDLDTYFTSIYATYSLPHASIPVYSAGVAPQPNIGNSTIMI